MKQINIQSLYEEQLTTYQDNNMAILRNIQEIQKPSSEYLLLDSFAFIVVMQGNAQCFVDDCVCNLQAGDIFLCKPKRILKKSMLSFDFDIYAVFFQIDYLIKIVKDMNLSLDIKQLLKDYTIIHCQEDELNHVKTYIQLIQDKLKNADTALKKKSIDMLFGSMVYELKDINSREDEEEENDTVISSGKNIVTSFLEMLNNQDSVIRSVNGYANHLHHSAKYFSSLCKQYTGKTARELINEEVIHRSQVLLKDNQYTIQQIADRLGFVNQSHFGVFFKRHTGLSPQKYRASSLD